jgi:hypothetical protein
VRRLEVLTITNVPIKNRTYFSLELIGIYIKGKYIAFHIGKKTTPVYIW